MRSLVAGNIDSDRMVIRVEQGKSLLPRRRRARRTRMSFSRPTLMPAVLKPEAWSLWLGEEPAEPAELKALLAPFPSEEMTCWPVSSRVGNVRNNDANLIEPIAA